MSLITNALRYPVLISYLSGANNYSYIHFRTGGQLMISKSLSYLEKQLPDFVRVHKTVLVNPESIRKLRKPPHSKTSGAIVLENELVLPVSRRQWPVLKQAIERSEMEKIQPERTITFITGDITKSLLLRQLITDRWPRTLVHIMDNGSILPNLLLSLAKSDYPALILLDLRQATVSRLNLLRELKEDPQLRWIPIVVLVAPETNAIGPGYALQANSAIVLSGSNSQFLMNMEQICGYWFTTAMVPE